MGESEIHMKDTDVFNHTYRMYLIGSNSISYPWYMPQNFPNDALSTTNRDRLL